jgi:hypothetical protein
MAVNQIIKNYTKKQIFKKEGIIGSAKAVEFSSNALEKRLQAFGIDTRLIQSETDLKQALAFVDQLESRALAQEAEKVFGKQSDLFKKDAKVFDLKGKELDPDKPIMGGTQEDSISRNIAEATKKGDFTGIKNQILRDPDIAREFALSKKFPFRRDTNVLSGEDAIPLARKAKFDEEMGIKSVAPRDYSVEKLVSDFKKFGKATDDDIQMILSSGKSSQIPYVMDNYGMSYKDVISTLKSGKPLIEGLASGGRAGFKVGSPSKRAFLKVMGGLAATIAAIKSGLIGTGGKETTKQVVKETAKDVANAPPKYFFDLANKIKLLGKESKVKPSERVNEYSYTGKNGDEYVMTEDISTGDIQITKDKTGVGSSGEKTFDVIEDKSVMNYKAPRKDADPDTQTILDEGAEYDEFQVTFDAEGSMADGDVIQDSIKKEIIEEAADIPIKQKIKRAGGGVAYMLGE